MRSRWLGVGVVAAMWIFALAVYGRLPAMVPTHWNLWGEVDGWSPKSWGAFVTPFIATVMLALPWLMRRIDPRRANVERSVDDVRLIRNLIVLFMALVEGATLGAALGWPVDVTAVAMGGVGLMLAGIGNYLPRMRSNWWIGIRTPWTLSSERVWRDTHRLGGRLMVACGLVMAAAALLPSPARGYVAVAAIAVMALVPAVYSFVAWRRESA